MLNVKSFPSMIAIGPALFRAGPGYAMMCRTCHLFTPARLDCRAPYIRNSHLCVSSPGFKPCSHAAMLCCAVLRDLPLDLSQLILSPSLPAWLVQCPLPVKHPCVPRAPLQRTA